MRNPSGVLDNYHVSGIVVPRVWLCFPLLDIIRWHSLFRHIFTIDCVQLLVPQSRFWRWGQQIVGITYCSVPLYIWLSFELWSPNTPKRRCTRIRYWYSPDTHPRSIRINYLNFFKNILTDTYTIFCRYTMVLIGYFTYTYRKKRWVKKWDNVVNIQ